MEFANFWSIYPDLPRSFNSTCVPKSDPHSFYKFPTPLIPSYSFLWHRNMPFEPLFSRSNPVPTTNTFNPSLNRPESTENLQSLELTNRRNFKSVHNETEHDNGRRDTSIFSFQGIVLYFNDCKHVFNAYF